MSDASRENADIDASLRALKLEVEKTGRELSVVAGKVDCVDRKVSDMKRELVGDFEKPGLVRRVENIEHARHEEKTTRLRYVSMMWAALLASFLAVGRAIWEVLRS